MNHDNEMSTSWLLGRFRNRPRELQNYFDRKLTGMHNRFVKENDKFMDKRVNDRNNTPDENLANFDQHTREFLQESITAQLNKIDNVIRNRDDVLHTMPLGNTSEHELTQITNEITNTDNAIRNNVISERDEHLQVYNSIVNMPRQSNILSQLYPSNDALEIEY